MEKAKSITDLIVWQKAHQFVLDIYRITKVFPKEELYSLTSQFRRAAISITANIAKGFHKRVKLDKVRFLYIVEGPLEECNYYLILAEDQEYCKTNELNKRLIEVSKHIGAYSRAIKSSNSQFLKTKF